MDNFVYHWWMGPTSFTLLTLLWARFWPLDNFTDEIILRPALIAICLFLSMVSWIIGGFLK